MKKWLLIAALLVAGFQYAQQSPWAERDKGTSELSASQPPAEVNDDLARAFAERRSNVQVSATGVVARVLADDNDGARHQRFLLRLPSGQTLLIAHNIDLAPRLTALRTGDTVAFMGEYEWNERGGVVHWTHRDPTGKHAAGWLRHRGTAFQ